MNKEVFNPTLDFSSFPIQDIAPIIDSFSNIINSVSCIVESNNSREVSLANVYANHDLEMKKLEIAHADYLASLGLSREEFPLFYSPFLPQFFSVLRSVLCHFFMSLQRQRLGCQVV